MLDDSAPVIFTVGASSWHALPDGNIMVVFTTPIPGPVGSDKAQTMNLRISARMVMSPQVAAATGAFLAQAFPMAPGSHPPDAPIQ